jgi:sterol 14alpha-demethylase
MNFANNEMMIITAMLFQQFDLELVTQKPQVIYGIGACHPEKTLIRYSRKKRDLLLNMEKPTTTQAFGCPHLLKV